MRVIVIGDISGGGNYHLGDEAMSEVAVAELRKRGAEVVIIADRPQISEPLYGVRAVRRFELWRSADRAAKLARMDEILAGVRGTSPLPDEVRETVDAVRSADAVVVAGGGNLNSHMTENHLLERVLLKRVSQHLGIPMYVSSQTVGPVVTGEDRVLLGELASYARVFGAREAATAELMREICDGHGTIVQTLDDVILMDPSSPPRTIADAPEPGSYVVGSFTMHSGTTGLSREEYYRAIAGILDTIVERCDVDVLLLPHMGKLGEDNGASPKTDVFGHNRIAAATRGRVHSLEMMRSEELAALTQHARFTISTRYHPVVFGAGLGVPAIGLVTSFYSAVRMRGALVNVGMESLAIPFESWDPLFGAPVLDAVAHQRSQLDAHIQDVRTQQREYQSRWWDGIVADISGTGQVLGTDCVAPTPYEWASAQDQRLLEVVRIGQEKGNREVLSAEVASSRSAYAYAELKQRLADLEIQLEGIQGDQAWLKHKVRPIGAGFRDRVRGFLERK